MVKIIAEIGVNHNGSLDKAFELVDVAIEAGADVVKFQTGNPKNVISHKAPKANYQIESTGDGESQLEMVKKLVLKDSEYLELAKYCKTKNIEFLATPFDKESVDLLSNTMKLPQLKIASGEVTNAQLLHYAARTNKKIILSTGMSTLAEVEVALGILAHGYLYPSQKPLLSKTKEVFCSVDGQDILKKKVGLLHCTTEYPSPYSSVNLRAMDTLKAAFNLPVGLSDHTSGVYIPIAAVARGATIIEKHFTLNKNLPGPDHKASLEPKELKDMVLGIRAVEESIGHGVKIPAPAEVHNIDIARRSLVAAIDIKKGDVFTEENLTCKRPGTGKSSIYYWSFIGIKSKMDFLQDEIISS
jgi:N-acetylneuraminate synthase